MIRHIRHWVHRMRRRHYKCQKSDAHPAFLSTIGKVSEATIRRYIQEQKGT